MGFIDRVKTILGLREPDPDEVEANAYAAAIVRELNRMGKCYLKKTKDGNIFQEVRFKPPLKILPDRVELEVDAANLPYGIGLSELKDSKIVEGVEAILKRPVSVRHNRRAGFWYVVRRVDVVKPNFYYTDLRSPRGYDADKTPLLLPFGRDDQGEQLWRDMERIYHVLIGGATGKGKTSLIHSQICWLIQHAAPERARLILVDLKEGLDFSRYNGVPHLLMPVCITAQEAYTALQAIDKEITRRGALFREVNAENIDTYRRRSGNVINNIVFIFDEITNLGKLPSSEEAQAWFWLRDGAQRARALGIHFVISTQRPSVQVIDGDIKMNFTARVGLGTATDVDSRVILDNNMATGLEIGDLVYQDSRNRGTALRGPYITSEQADQIIASVTRNFHQTRAREAKEAELVEQQREALAQRLLDYAADHLDGDFSIDRLYAVFSAEVTKEELRDIAQSLEDQNVLSPAAGRRPRQVIVYNLSFGGNDETPPENNDNNGHIGKNGKEGA
jgi:S-DNA-T family DNA segregation ATPase FtsK/SpoIIIE